MATYRTIKYGSQGEDVKRLQEMLNAAGSSLVVDGKFGAKTQAAVKQYQQGKGLVVDGIVGKNTWNALTGAGDAPQGQVDVNGGQEIWSGSGVQGSGANSAAVQLYQSYSGGGASAPAHTEYSWTAPPAHTEYSWTAPPAYTADSWTTPRPEYRPSDAVTQAEQQLAQWEANRPGEYESPYQQKLEALYNEILNRGDFSYDPKADPLYERYKDRYTAGGQLAMQDAMAKAAALSGGYGNSYAQTVGQQQYGAYMTALADILPELEARAYGRWQDEGKALYDQFALTQGRDNTEYGRYRDGVGDYYKDLGYAYGKYQDAYGNAYNQYVNDLAAWQNDRNFAYQQAQDALAQQNFEREFAWKQQQAALAAMSGGSSGGGSSSSRSSGSSSSRSSSSSSRSSGSSSSSKSSKKSSSSSSGKSSGMIGDKSEAQLQDIARTIWQNTGMADPLQRVDKTSYTAKQKAYIKDQIRGIMDRYSH